MLSTAYPLYDFPSVKVGKQPPASNSKPESEQTAYERANRDTVQLSGRSATLVTDLLAVTQFVGSGTLYRQAAQEAETHFQDSTPLADQPLVKLEDPLLILPGWTTRPDKFRPIMDHLLKNPENGDRPVFLKQGQAYLDEECLHPTTIKPTDRVFLAIYDSVVSPPDVTAPQIADAIRMMKENLGPKVDVLGYSMGGLAARKMLDGDLQTVDQLAMLGTANQGTRFAALASYVIRRDIGFAMSMANINAYHLPAFEWMMPVDAQNSQYSTKLSALNANIDHQVQNTNGMMAIGSNGFATITKSWGATEGGDGLVGQSSIKVGDVPTVILEGRKTKGHGALPQDADAFQELKKFFGWQSVAQSKAGPAT